MKNYGKIVPLVLAGVLILSWYVLLDDKASVNKEYDNYLKQARQYAEVGITTKAIENYEAALNTNSTIEIYQEVADYYKSREMFSKQISWCEKFVVDYPTNKESYDYLLAAYLDQKDYVSCYNIIAAAEKRGVTSDYMKQMYEEMAYYFELDNCNYKDVGIYSNNYCPVYNEKGWGYVDRYGKLRISCKYVEVGAYTKTNLTPVVNSEGEAYFIDKTGSRMLATNDKYLRYGLLVDGIMTAQREDQKYVYVNDTFEVLFGEYDYASGMNYGVAAVKNGSEWSIIDNTGKALSDKKYTDIKLDEKGIAYRNERLFVSTGSGYMMVDSSGKQIGKQVYEDAKVFSDTTYTAVKIDGKWCFVDKDGKLKSDKTYEDARSYLNGLAAVKIAGKWGFVDENEKLVIENNYDETRDFNEKGSCFVKIGDSWQLLKLYRLNREG